VSRENRQSDVQIGRAGARAPTLITTSPGPASGMCTFVLNLAWGIIDGVLYLMGCLAEKGRGLLTFRAVRKTTDQHKRTAS